jgi:hypothetical protein
MEKKGRISWKEELEFPWQFIVDIIYGFGVRIAKPHDE